MKAWTRLALASFAALGLSTQAMAETVKVAIGQRGNWDTAVSELGQRGGIFKKHDLELELLYTQGGGETQQAVISGSVDIGVAAGTLGVLGAFSKGAPVRIIGAQSTGAADYWYVRGDSPIQTLKDAPAGTTVAYSTNGSSTHSVALGFAEQFKPNLRLVATGSPPGTFTQVMSGQIAVGWASPPFAFDALAANRIRIVARANDVEAIRNQSIRALIANLRFIETRKPLLERYMRAYRETVDWMYSSDEALKIYAEFANTDLDSARRVRDDFITKPMLDPDRMSGMEALMADAVTFKVLPAPLSADRQAELIRIPPRQ